MSEELCLSLWWGRWVLFSLFFFFLNFPFWLLALLHLFGFTAHSCANERVHCSPRRHRDDLIYWLAIVCVGGMGLDGVRWRLRNPITDHFARGQHLPAVLQKAHLSTYSPALINHKAACRWGMTEKQNRLFHLGFLANTLLSRSFVVSPRGCGKPRYAGDVLGPGKFPFSVHFWKLPTGCNKTFGHWATGCVEREHKRFLSDFRRRSWGSRQQYRRQITCNISLSFFLPSMKSSHGMMFSFHSFQTISGELPHCAGEKSLSSFGARPRTHERVGKCKECFTYWLLILTLQ